MEFTRIIYENITGVVWVKLNRPEVLNAIDARMMDELRQAFEKIEDDDTARVAVITGVGRAFSSGADLRASAGRTGQPGEALKALKRTMCIELYIQDLDKPVIASINGFALAGGLELALACDLRLAAEDAQLGDWHINVGISPGGGAAKLCRIVGQARAKELLFTGDAIDGREAERIGLVNHAVPANQLQQKTEELARKLAGKSPQLLKGMKRLVNQGSQMDYATALQLEAMVFETSRHSPDAKKGIQSFLDRQSYESK